MAYSATGETWVIFTYAQLKFYQTPTVPVALVELKDQNAVVVQRFNIINSNSTMAQLLNGICVIAFHVHFYSYDTTAQNLRYVLALVWRNKNHPVTATTSDAAAKSPTKEVIESTMKIMTVRFRTMNNISPLVVGSSMDVVSLHNVNDSHK